MSLASLVMSRPGSVLDSSERPGSALSLLSMSTVQAGARTPARAKTAKMRAAVSLNSVDTSRGDVNFCSPDNASVKSLNLYTYHYHLQILFSERFTEQLSIFSNFVSTLSSIEGNPTGSTVWANFPISIVSNRRQVIDVTNHGK